jgi:hypothetical protein
MTFALVSESADDGKDGSERLDVDVTFEKIRDINVTSETKQSGAQRNAVANFSLIKLIWRHYSFRITRVL